MRELVYRGARSVGEKHGPRLRAQLDDMPGAIVFFVPARPLVLLDDIVLVIVQRKCSRHTGLRMSLHAQSIQVKRRIGFLCKGRIALQCSIPLRRGPIDDVCVRIGAGRKIDFGTGHMKETQGIPRRERSRLVSIDDVIGHGGDASGCSRSGTKGTEGLDGSHREPSIITAYVRCSGEGYRRGRVDGNSIYCDTRAPLEMKTLKVFGLPGPRSSTSCRPLFTLSVIGVTP